MPVMAQNPNPNSSGSPQVVCCGGGGGTPYPSSSPYYVLNEFFDGSGTAVVLRQGSSTSNFGWNKIQSKHGIYDTNILQWAVEDGYKWFNSGTNNYNYGISVYNVPVYDSTGYLEWTHVLLAANLQTVMQDGYYLGVLTAYCPPSSGLCPWWVTDGYAGFLASWNGS
ncbi:MAG: hypothetical protein ACYDEA_01755 [Candidatus Dormibacteria bacterium]